jgi:hypothetical protein
LHKINNLMFQSYSLFTSGKVSFQVGPAQPLIKQSKIV